MRTKTIIDGFKNSQKFRFILEADSGELFGLTMTIQQMTDMFATTVARQSVWVALERLAYNRQHAMMRGDTLPTSLVTDTDGFRQVQVDLM